MESYSLPHPSTGHVTRVMLNSVFNLSTPQPVTLHIEASWMAHCLRLAIFLEHFEQEYVSRVWFHPTWSARFFLEVKDLPQKLQPWGRTPWWVWRTCLRRLLRFNTFPQWGQGHLAFVGFDVLSRDFVLVLNSKTTFSESVKASGSLKKFGIYCNVSHCNVLN